MQEGISGKIAQAFMNSKLTILLMIGLMIIGVYSSFLIPREEEPQINVPMADVMIGYPGASPSEVESRVIKPLEKVLSNIKGVEHLHSMYKMALGLDIQICSWLVQHQYGWIRQQCCR